MGLNGNESDNGYLAGFFITKLYEVLISLPGIQGTAPLKKRILEQTKVDRWDFGAKVFKGDIKGDAELNGQSILVNLSLKTRIARKKDTQQFRISDYLVVTDSKPALIKADELKKKLSAMLKVIDA